MFKSSTQLLLCLFSSALLSSAASIYVTGQSTVQSYSTFNVYVGINDAYYTAGVAGFQFELSWDWNKFNLVSETEGNFLNYGGNPSVPTYFTAFPSSLGGGSNGAADTVGKSPATLSKGTLAVFTFQNFDTGIFSPESTEMDLSNVLLIDYTNTLLPFNIVDPAFVFNIGSVASAPVPEPPAGFVNNAGQAPPPAVPEPASGSLLLLSAGLFAVGLIYRRRTRVTE